MPLLNGISKGLAVLVDPDKIGEKTNQLTDLMSQLPPTMILVGGSTSTSISDSFVNDLRERVGVPVILFPGNASQFTASADGIFFLSLISGRNPEWLIGQQVKAAKVVKSSGMEVIPVGYMLIESGGETAVQRVSHTEPIGRDAIELAVSTALAGELLGLQAIYLEGGSGAKHPVPISMVKAVRQAVSVPIIVGGGLRSAEEVQSAWKAGADLVVIGNALEQDPELYLRLIQSV